MTIEYNYKISGYSFSIMSAAFGWIQLMDGDKDAGYIYFQDESEKDRFGGESSGHPYVVMFQPIQMWNTILEILRKEHNVFIRGFQGVTGGDISAFLETH